MGTKEEKGGKKRTNLGKDYIVGGKREKESQKKKRGRKKSKKAGLV